MHNPAVLRIFLKRFLSMIIKIESESLQGF